MRKGLNKKLLLICSLILFRLFLDYFYFNEIVARFNYYGFEDYRTFASFTFSWIVLFAFMWPILKVIKKETSLSSVIVLVVSVISIPSLTTLICANFLDGKFIAMSIAYWFFLFLFYFLINKKEPKKIGFRFGSIKLDDRVALLLGIFSLLLVLYISWKYTGFRINFNLDNVYDLRDEARTYDFPVIVQYLFNWTRSINVLFLAYYLFKKRYLFASLFLVSQILSFGIDGLKTTLFMTVLTIVLSFFFNKKRQESSGYYIVHGVTWISFFAVLEKFILNGSKVIDLVIRRVMILPVYLNSRYVDFFSNNQPDFFRRSFLKLLGFSSQYNNLEFLIGDIYFNKPLMRCNNGLLSEAVTNFGVVGIVLGPILLILVLRLMDKCTVGLNKKLLIIVGIYFGLRFIDTFASIGLFTHGFFITVILMMLLRDTEGNCEDNPPSKVIVQKTNSEV